VIRWFVLGVAEIASDCKCLLNGKKGTHLAIQRPNWKGLASIL
jgi:hypothetical protein